MHTLSIAYYRKIFQKTDLLGSIAIGLVVWLAALLCIETTPRTFLFVGFEPNPQWKLIAFALVVASLALPSNVTAAQPWWIGLALFALCALLWPATPNFQVLTVLVILWIVATRVRLANWAAGRLGFAANILCLCIAVDNVYDKIDSRISVLPGLQSISCLILKICAIDSTINNDFLYVNLHGVTYRMLVSLDKLGGSFPWILMFGFGYCIYLRTRRLSYVATTVLIVAFGSVCFSVAGYCISAGTSNNDWWTESIIAIGYLPLVSIVALIYFVSKKVKTDAKEFKVSSSSFVLTLGASIILCSSIFYVDGGPKSNGKVVIDDLHSDWEWLDTPLDTYWYGMRSTYNYYNFQEGLSRYYSVSLNHSPITTVSLESVSVLILKTPTQPYSLSEIEAIVEFVDRGGGLWIIGDHTDAFGMSTYLNPILSRFGSKFEFNAVGDPMYRRNLYASNRFTSGLYPDLSTFLFYTSGQIRAPLLWNDSIHQGRLLLDEGDYSAGTFFGNMEPDIYEHVGHVTEASEGSYGNGRVAIWSDSTLFSNFSIFMPGKFEVAIQTVDWLDRQRAIGRYRPLLFLFGGIVFLLGARNSVTGQIALSALLGCSLAILFTRLLHSWEFPNLRPIAPFRDVGFYEPAKLGYFPELTSIDKSSPVTNLSAFIACQRVGKRGRILDDLSTVSQYSQIVLIPSRTQFERNEISLLRSWVRRGGELIVLDGCKLGIDAGRQLAEIGDLKLAELPRSDLTGGVNELRSGTGMQVGMDGTRVGVLQGSLVLAKISNSGTAVGVERKVGLGRLVFFSTCSLFSDDSLSLDEQIPSTVQLEARWLLYGILDNRFIDKQPTRLPNLDHAVIPMRE